MTNLDFDPDTKPGYCPVCAKPATIWNVMQRTWECSYCNWSGRMTDQTPFIKLGETNENH